MEMQNLEFAMLDFVLPLVWYFLTMFLCLHFGTLKYILDLCMLEICDLLFDTDFTGDYS